MAHPNEEITREAIAAFQRGDLEALQNTYFADDIRYHVSGRSPISGTYEGAAQVIALFVRLFELTGGNLSIDLHDAVGNDEHAVALFTIRAEREGNRLADNAVLITHIQDGKATEMWIQAADQYAVDEFWS
jgi:uncharacterized protein